MGNPQRLQSSEPAEPRADVDDFEPGSPSFREGVDAPFVRSALFKTIGSGEKRIGFPLDANRSLGPGRIVQGKELGLDALHQGVEITSWKVGAANGPIEQHVAPQYGAVALKRDTSG